MLDFNYYSPTRVIFGKKSEEQVGELCAKYGKKVLLHYGGGSIKKNGVYDKVVQSLTENNLQIVELPGVHPNPRLSLVYDGIKMCREENIDFILAVGGGSVIDSAKAIAAGVKSSHDVWDYYLGKAGALKDALPIGVVLTIPAAGSETGGGTVLTNEDGQLKRSFGAEVLCPKFAIMNPKFTFTLPAYQTACGVADILAHLMERYFVQTDSVDFTDRMIEATYRTVLFNAPVVMKKADDYAGRAEIMWAGTIAHNGLLDTGRGGDWASHGIEHELSGIYDIAHGAGLSIIFPAWMKYVYKENIDRFVQFAVRIFDVDLTFCNREKIVLEGISRMENFFKSLGLPTRLSDTNIGEDRLREMADKCVAKGQTIGGFMKLSSDDVYEIYKLAL